MRHGTAALVALFAILLAHPLQHDPPVGQRRVIGLVEIPRLLGEQANAQGPPPDVLINLFQEPAASSPIAVTVRDRERLEVREHGYEEFSAVAYERRAGWYLLRMRTRFAWLQPGDAGAFRAYPEFLKDKLVYLTRDWDRTLHRSPGGPVSAKVPPESTEPPGERSEDFGDVAARPFSVDFTGLRMHDGEWWARVRVGPSDCEEPTNTPRVIAEGWLPAYSRGGSPTLWFFSRGC